MAGSDRYYSWLRRRPIFDAIAAGASVLDAVAVVGAARSACRKWWEQSSGMDLEIGPPGGLGVVPVADGFVGDKLTALDRDRIATGLAAGMPQASIARLIARSASPVSREVRRDAGPDGVHCGSLAHVKAHQRSRRSKPFKLDGRADLIAAITSGLNDGWSPRLIALVLAKQSGGDQTAQVSHETIYQSAELRRVQEKLNSRPRPALGLKTPAQELAEYLEQQAA